MFGEGSAGGVIVPLEQPVEVEVHSRIAVRRWLMVNGPRWDIHEVRPAGGSWEPTIDDRP